MKSREARKQLFEQFARIAKASASPQRLALLEILAQGDRTVEALATVIGLPLANTSHHLQILKRAGLVETRRDGIYIHYRLADPAVHDLVAAVRTLAERRLAEVDRLVKLGYHARDAVAPIGRDELLTRVRAGHAVVVDVRPGEEFQAGHIEGAISVPIAELAARLSELPADREVVAYCRGPYCVLGLDAVEILRAQGFTARRLREGFPEWKAAGFPVVEGGQE